MNWTLSGASILLITCSAPTHPAHYPISDQQHMLFQYFSV